MILGLRTDSPEAELILYGDDKIMENYKWHADRQLAKSLLAEIDKLISRNNSSWDDCKGLVVFEGPGSFTGLRIGITVANSIAYANRLGIVGTSGDEWFADGLEKLKSSDSDIVMPVYGALPHITKPKK